MFEIFKEFRFEAAHSLHPREVSEGPYTRLHGHSFRAELFIRGARSDEGWVIDLGEVERLIGGLRAELDHRFLNDIPELGPPTLENLACLIWNRLAPEIPGLHKVAVHRDSRGEGCFYYGSAKP